MDICLLGASGSIGKQTLDVMGKDPIFHLVAFSVGKNTRVIKGIISKNPEVKYVYLIENKKKKYYEERYPNITFFSSKDKDGLVKLITLSNCDMVVNALVGFAGLLPSIEALKNNKKLALANKESLIIGGEFINALLKEGKGQLYPIDSEHSALWKCLKVDDQNVDKLILTASGGAFRKLSREELKDVKASEALKHPTWKMGNKITIDCATMINKCFELIEAYYLFGYKRNQLDVILHDESELHSCVLYKNGLYRGEINHPDMRNPIKFALYEGNIPFDTETFNSFEDLKGLHFHKFDIKRYPLVSLAELVMKKRGNMGAIVNAANEVANKAYLEDKISYYQMEDFLFDAVKHIRYIKHPSLEEIVRTHKRTMKYVTSLVKEKNR